MPVQLAFKDERLSASSGKQSKLAEVIEGILGRELSTKELQGGLDLEDLIYKECSIPVLQSKSKTGACSYRLWMISCGRRLVHGGIWNKLQPEILAHE